MKIRSWGQVATIVFLVGVNVVVGLRWAAETYEAAAGLWKSRIIYIADMGDILLYGFFWALAWGALWRSGEGE